MKNLSDRDIERFNKRVKKSDGCWKWTGKLRPDGYGRMLTHPEGKKPTIEYVHRIAWIMENGSVPEGFSVYHTCGCRECCNPLHLRLEVCRRK